MTIDEVFLDDSNLFTRSQTADGNRLLYIANPTLIIKQTKEKR